MLEEPQMVDESTQTEEPEVENATEEYHGRHYGVRHGHHGGRHGHHGRHGKHGHFGGHGKKGHFKHGQGKEK